MYQARNNTLPVSIQHIFTRYEGKLLNTRQQIDCVDKFARTNVRAMSMRIVGVVHRDSLFIHVLLREFTFLYCADYMLRSNRMECLNTYYHYYY